jgi:hypothetical protein
MKVRERAGDRDLRTLIDDEYDGYHRQRVPML